MLRNTFLHLPSIGRVSEQSLWRRGVTDWDGFLARWDDDSLFPFRRESVRRALLQSKHALALGDAAHFARSLPKSEYWRVWPEFGRDACFMDCETTGLSPSSDDLTVVGIADAKGRVESFVRGENLKELPDYLSRFKLMVSFNGWSFDDGFLREQFGSGYWRGVHWDLRWTLARHGLKGGLKRIERELGFARERDVAAVDGLEAVRLWKRWRQAGDSGARDLLLRYNAADVVVLKDLAEKGFELSRGVAGLSVASS
ncbi:MAG TPA: ribonuclease H-like domain-containing protein [Candidatus Norongarragalinales archaeon]|jgi:hypothetical protein|nr:ribonuclease H-like domain-containing protein [Candidatus Norongarragalinales archaeon]